MTDRLPEMIRQRLEKVIMTVPGPALKELCEWLEEVKEGGADRGFDSLTFRAYRGEVSKSTERTRK
ncbi:MAG: hypothetical protein WC891_02895 [Actinomycetota bacterium]